MKAVWNHPWARRGVVLLALLFTLVVLRDGPQPALPTAPGLPTALLFLSPSSAPEVWIHSPERGETRKITSTNGGVYDFSVDPFAGQILFSARNADGGYDLWQTSRDGQDAQVLLPCGPDWCTGAAAAPGGDTLAYSRRTFSGLPGSEPGLGQIWILDRTTGSTDLLFADPNVAGESAAWSPGGRYLAFFDPRSQQVGVVEFAGSFEFFFPAGEGAGLAWSPDGNTLAVTRPESTGEAPYTVIYLIDMQTQQANMWMGEDALDIGVPAWSPDGRWLLAPVRLVGGVAGRGLWLMPLEDASNRQVITQDAMANDSSPQWQPGGGRVAFQRLALGTSGSRPAVMVWDRSTGAVQTLAEDAFQPRWIGK